MRVGGTEVQYLCVVHPQSSIDKCRMNAICQNKNKYDSNERCSKQWLHDVVSTHKYCEFILSNTHKEDVSNASLGIPKSYSVNINTR